MNKSSLVGTRVALTQPYVPAYRKPLWDRIIRLLAEQDVEARVFYGWDVEQARSILGRGDAVHPAWATFVPSRSIRTLPGLPKLQYRRLPKGWRGRSVLLVTEMQAANLNAWAAAHLDKPYLTLGHGMSDTTNAGKLASTLETHLNKHAAHVLTYSDEGREYVTGKGIDPSKVTAFHNATDTRRLQHALQNSTLSVQTAFRTEHGIPTSASVALYLGALNRHKNIDLLVEAARLVFRADPNRWLVVAGDGEHRHKLERLASQSARVVMLGQANAEDYAPIAKSCTVLLNPGRVGLVAVDALVMGVPVLSTQTAAHAPEFAYLRPGIDVLETESTAEAYASAWLSVERSSNTTRTMYPSVEEAANTITQVILAVLRSDRLSVRR